MHAHRGHDTRDLVGQLPKWCTGSYTRYDTHSLNTSCRFIPRHFKLHSLRTAYTTWCSPHLDQMLCRVAFYEEIWEARRAATWALNAWNFDAQGYISQLWFWSSIARSIKAFLFNITHRSQVSLGLGCCKYWLYVFIRLPFLPLTDV